MMALNFEMEGNQEMIQEIKNKIETLSQKDLLTEKILKMEVAIKNVKEEARRIYSEPKEGQKPLELHTFLEDIFENEEVPPRKGSVLCDTEAAIKVNVTILMLSKVRP